MTDILALLRDNCRTEYYRRKRVNAEKAEAERHNLLIRSDLRTWCIEALSGVGLHPAKHHELLIEHLMKVTTGEIDRLMVLMPPGSAKSTYVSQLYVPHYLANHPDHAIIAASHTAELAERFGRRARNTLAEYSAQLGIAPNPDVQAASRWETIGGGEYKAIGIGGAIAGRRADLAIIDDPVRSREEADSDLTRERTWDWWVSDLIPRLKPGGRVVVIMTRWHEDDLGGRLLEDMATGGKPWTVLRLPMEAEANDPLGRTEGEPLWPEWFTDDQRREAKRDARTWSALYQQAPAPDTGTYFHLEWIRPVTSMPPRDTLRIYGGSDYAVTENGGDFTVHAVVGIDASARMWLLDLWREQTTSDVWVETFCDMVRQWKPMAWAQETGQIKAGVGPFLTRRMRERQAFVFREDFPTRGDKGIRAQAIRGRMALDGLYIPASAPWRQDFESELLSFPVGKHDDQVDALGLIGQLLDRMVTPAHVPEPEEPRGLHEMTMAEAFTLANPRSRYRSAERRI